MGLRPDLCPLSAGGARGHRALAALGGQNDHRGRKTLDHHAQSGVRQTLAGEAHRVRAGRQSVDRLGASRPRGARAAPRRLLRSAGQHGPRRAFLGRGSDLRLALRRARDAGPGRGRPPLRWHGSVRLRVQEKRGLDQEHSGRLPPHGLSAGEDGHRWRVHSPGHVWRRLDQLPALGHPGRHVFSQRSGGRRLAAGRIGVGVEALPGPRICVAFGVAARAGRRYPLRACGVGAGRPDARRAAPEGRHAAFGPQRPVPQPGIRHAPQRRVAGLLDRRRPGRRGPPGQPGGPRARGLLQPRAARQRPAAVSGPQRDPVRAHGHQLDPRGDRPQHAIGGSPIAPARPIRHARGVHARCQVPGRFG